MKGFAQRRSVIKEDTLPSLEYGNCFPPWALKYKHAETVDSLRCPAFIFQGN